MICKAVFLTLLKSFRLFLMKLFRLFSFSIFRQIFEAILKLEKGVYRAKRPMKGSKATEKMAED